ncbi:MAG: EpsI family protein [Rhodospirillaceae bacterium]|nr:EpsI family protein [Rhodospirillaceae bacterium]
MTEGSSTLPVGLIAWPKTIAIIAAGIGVLVAVFWPTVASAVHQWNTSSAYNYGFLIAPISLYLIWSERAVLSVWRPRASPWGIAVMTAFAAAWLVADIIGIDEGRHIAFVGMLQGLFLAVLGWPLYRRVAFALQYLWLQVPTGEFLLEPLQKLTHWVAVWMLKLSGMPVYGEGILIQVPSGNFLVEPGCAGLNFLLASIALALLYGKLTYKRWSTRLVCLAVAVVASILANFLRVYLIVAITEWTDRRIDITDDHLFYGWVFFGIIMLAMMWFGMRYRDTDDVKDPAAERPSPRVSASAKPLAAAAAGCLAIAVGAAGLAGASTLPVDAEDIAVTLPADIGGWMRSGMTLEWRPTIVSGGSTAVMSYARAGRTADVAVGYFPAQSDGAEAAAADNRPGQADRWEEIGRRVVTLGDGSAGRTAVRADLRGPSGQRTTYFWYVSSGCVTHQRLIAKVCTLKDRLRGQPSAGAVVMVSVPVGADQADTASVAAALAPAFDDLDALVTASAPAN